MSVCFPSAPLIPGDPTANLDAFCYSLAHIPSPSSYGPFQLREAAFTFTFLSKRCQPRGPSASGGARDYRRAERMEGGTRALSPMLALRALNPAYRHLPS